VERPLKIGVRHAHSVIRDAEHSIALVGLICDGDLEDAVLFLELRIKDVRGRTANCCTLTVVAFGGKLLPVKLAESDG
jgi:hypothetical protein